MRDKIKESLDRYANDHCPTGDFLAAVLSNDLMDAIGRADKESMADLFSICDYVYNHIPARCHGSRKIVREWIAKKPKESETNEDGH